MRPFVRLTLIALAFSGGIVSVSRAQPAAGDQQQPPQQVQLTQSQIDDLIAAQSEMRPIEEKMSQDGPPDPKLEAKMTAIAKKHGFASEADYAAASYSVGIVLAGMDPETKTYVGPSVLIKKQIAEVKADGKMPPHEKKQALQELTSELQTSGADKPLPANIDLVGKNFEKLDASQQNAN